MPADTSGFTGADRTKLDSIESGAQVNKGLGAVAALPGAAAYGAGTVAYLEGDGWYEVIESGEASATLSVAWTPVADPDGNDPGFVSGADVNYGTRPAGMPAGVYSFFADDADHRIWMKAASGVFAAQGVIVTIGDRVWDLAYDETVDSVDQFFSGGASAAPWNAGAAVTLVIHALGGVAPFTARAKSWQRLASGYDGRGLPQQLEYDGRLLTLTRQGLPALSATIRAPRGLTFPAAPAVSDRFELEQGQAVSQDAKITPAAMADVSRNAFAGAGLGDYAVNVYPTVYPNSELINRVVVVAPSSGAAPAKLWLDGRAYALTNLGGALPLYYRAATLTSASLTAGTGYNANLEFGDGSKLLADREYSPGVYDWNGNSWEYAPGSVANWAVAGSLERIPRSKIPSAGLRVLLDGQGDGITVSNSSVSRRNSLSLFAPAFDLDDGATQAGIVEADAVFRFGTRSIDGIGFGSELDGTARITGFTTASALRSATAYSSGADQGVLIGSADVYNVAVKLGELKLYLGRNAANQVGYFAAYHGASGSANFSCFLAMEVVLIHNDTGNIQPALPDLTVTRTQLASDRAIATVRTNLELLRHPIDANSAGMYQAVLNVYMVNHLYRNGSRVGCNARIMVQQRRAGGVWVTLGQQGMDLVGGENAYVSAAGIGDFGDGDNLVFIVRLTTASGSGTLGGQLTIHSVGTSWSYVRTAI